MIFILFIENSLPPIFDYLDIIFTVIGVFCSIVTFFSTFFALCKGRIRKYIKSYRLKRILNFKNHSVCEIILPVFEGTLTYTHQEETTYKKKTGKEVSKYGFINCKEAEALIILPEILHEARITNNVELKNPKDSGLNANNNKVVLGGPLANDYQYSLFDYRSTSTFAFKKRMLFGLKETYNKENQKSRHNIIRQMDATDDCQFCLWFEDPQENKPPLKINIPSAYIVLIKKRLHKQGVVFSCFGNSDVTSKKSLTCLLEYTDKIYHLSKKHRDEFFFIFKCSELGELSFDSENVIDLTNFMFK